MSTPAASPQDTAAALRRTPLFDLHRELGARIVPFAGYEMPVQYEGILAEHRWTREHAGLFDVSHMGQRYLVGPDHAAASAALEALTPGSFGNLFPGRMRYTLLLTPAGGIIDDLMVTRSSSGQDDGVLLLVFNAGRKKVDDLTVREGLPADVRLDAAEDRALLALQGPEAARVLARHCPQANDLTFMTAASGEFDGIECHVSRSGYTGEDGFEISVSDRHVEDVARTLLGEAEVKPIGLGARDSLRLEAGLPLYGHDLDETTSPVEAGLSFAIARSRRSGGFPGADRIIRELANGPTRRRVGLRPKGRAPIREGVDLQGPGGTPVGRVTSGGFGPTLNAPVAMGYVAAPYTEPGTVIVASGRRGEEPIEVAPLPFVPPRYVRSAA
jgi:aminomethyltransferase